MLFVVAGEQDVKISVECEECCGAGSIADKRCPICRGKGELSLAAVGLDEFRQLAKHRSREELSAALMANP